MIAEWLVILSLLEKPLSTASVGAGGVLGGIVMRMKGRLDVPLMLPAASFSSIVTVWVPSDEPLVAKVGAVVEKLPLSSL